MPLEELSDRDALLVHFHVVQETLVHLSMVTNDKDLVFERNKYAEGLVRKANLQLLTIRNNYEQGEWYSTIDKQSYMYLIDPLSVATALRGAYECMLTLNHVFVNAPNPDEVELRYLLWALSTFISKDQGKPALFEEGKAKRDQNRKNLDTTVDYLMSLPIIQPLDEQAKRLIKGKAAVNTGDGWDYYIDGIKLERVKGGWHGLAERMPARENVFDNLYKLFSINAHPTWHSIHIVVHAFDLEGDEPENFRMMDTMLSTSAMIGAFIIYDYCTLFPEVWEAFEQLPPRVQELVNLLLSAFKGDEFRL